MKKLRQVTTRTAQRGPRGEGAKVVRDRLIAAASALPPEELTIRKVATMASLSPRMPMYVFGSMMGLHAAVAAEGYEELNHRLDLATEQAAVAGDALRAVTIEYLRFGLERPIIWRTMHSSELWSSISDKDDDERANNGSWAKNHPAYGQGWSPFKAVKNGRAAALESFAIAANDSGRPELGRLVQVLTSLIDGFLWQKHFEQVSVAPGEYAKLVDKVISGWR